MWLLFALLSFASYTLADLFGKKCTDIGNKYSYLEMIISVEFIAFLFGIFIYLFGLGESGSTPWQILFEHPLIILCSACVFIYWILFVVIMKYIGLSVFEAFSGSMGIFYFIGLILFNFVTGKVSIIRDMLHPLRLIPIIIVLVFVFLLSDKKVVLKNESEKLNNSIKYRKSVIFGLFLSLIACAVDSFDSIITTVIFDEGFIGATDIFMTSCFCGILPIIVFSAFLFIKNKKVFIPFKENTVIFLGYSFAALMSSALFTVASSFDAVRTGILFIAYPVVPIICSKLFLKEKYSFLQNLCIWMITVFSIVFCIIDKVL